MALHNQFQATLQYRQKKACCTLRDCSLSFSSLRIHSLWVLFNLDIYGCSFNKQQEIHLLIARWDIYILWIAPPQTWHSVTIYLHVPWLLCGFCWVDKSQKSAALCNLSQYQWITATTVVWPFDKEPLCLHLGFTLSSLRIIPWPLTFTGSSESAVVVLTVTKARWGFAASVTVKTKFPAELVRVSNWHRRFKWVPVMFVLFFTRSCSKGHVILYMCFLSGKTIELSQYIWIYLNYMVVSSGG